MNRTYVTISIPLIVNEEISDIEWCFSVSFKTVVTFYFSSISIVK